MNIKERVLTTMKTTYAKYGFKKDELESLASIVAANLKDESTDEEINTSVTNAEGYAKAMQSVYNRGVSETNKKYEGYIPNKKEPDPKKDHEPPVIVDKEPKPLTSEEIQKMISDGITAGLQPYKEKEEASRLQSILRSNSKLKDIPDVFKNRYHLDKEENLDNTVSQIESDYTLLRQKMIGSGQFIEAPKKASDEEKDDAFIKQMEDSVKRIDERNNPKQTN